MLKNFKNLFIKTEEEESGKTETKSESISFPLSSASPPTSSPPSNQSSYTPPPLPISDPVVNEVLKAYENGLESINMPGYDFYEFYQAVSISGNGTEQAYNMAFQMARSLDKTITAPKLIHDAEFYISKINEVYSQYVSQGQSKLNSIQEKKSGEKTKLNSEIDQASARIAQLKAELHQLESDINNKRNALGKIDETYSPQEKTIKEKLNANDFAKKTSIDKLNIIKEGIQRYIKG